MLNVKEDNFYLFSDFFSTNLLFIVTCLLLFKNLEKLVQFNDDPLRPLTVGILS